MAICRVFQNSDGSVRITRINLRARLEGIPRLSERNFLDQETTKDPSLAGLPFQDINEADIPANRVNRDKWRLQQVGNKFVCRVDNTVPDKPHPKQAMIDRANAATGVAELKAILADLLRGT